MSKQKYRTLLPWLAVGLFLLTIACSPNQVVEDKLQSPPNPSSPVAQPTKSLSPLAARGESGQDFGILMEEIAMNVLGVASATAIMNESDLIIGLRLNNITRSRKAIEQEVKIALTRQAPGYTIYVTSNRRLYDRIRLLRDQLRKGYQMQNLHNNMNAIIHEITASSPSK